MTLIVEIANSRPISAAHAQQVERVLSARMGMPMKQPPDMLAEVIYRYDDNVTVHIPNVPMRYSERTQRYTIHALIGKQVHERAEWLADHARRQQHPTMRGIPFGITDAPTDFLRAA